MLNSVIINKSEDLTSFNGACRRSALRCFSAVFFLLVLLIPRAYANTISWTGNSGTDWNTAANWSPQTVPGSGDDVQIAMIAYANQPVVSAATQCASLTFGTLQPILLTINASATLTVNGAITLLHSENNLVPMATITGAGNITCSSLVVGNGDFSYVLLTKTTRLVSAVSNFMVTGNIYINSVTSFLLSGGIGHNNSLLSLQAGQMNVSGQINLTNMLPAFLTGELTSLTPYARLSIDVASGQNPKLKVTGNPALVVTDPNWDKFDFYNDLTGFNGNGSANMEYGGATQRIMTNPDSGLNVIPQAYQNLTISGTGTKSTAGSSGDTLTVGGNLYVALDSLNMQVNHAALAVNGNFRNTGTTLLSNAQFFGGAFTNLGDLVSSTDTVRFPGNIQALSDSTSGGTSMTNVLFTSGTKTVSTGIFIIPAGGTWKVADDSTAMGVSPGAGIIFRSGGDPATLVFSGSGPRQLIGVNIFHPLAAKANRSLPASAVVKGIAANSPAVPVNRLPALKNSHKLPGQQSVKNLKPAVPSKINPNVQAGQELGIRLSGNKAAAEAILIVFRKKANMRYMPSEDKYAQPKRNAGVVFYSYSADHMPLSANSIPFPVTACTIEIFANAAKSGSYSITLFTNQLQANYQVMLKDKHTGSATDLRQQGTYTFSVNKNDKTSYGNRFELLIKTN